VRHEKKRRGAAGLLHEGLARKVFGLGRVPRYQLQVRGIQRHLPVGGVQLHCACVQGARAWRIVRVRVAQTCQGVHRQRRGGREAAGMLVAAFCGGQIAMHALVVATLLAVGLGAGGVKRQRAGK